MATAKLSAVLILLVACSKDVRPVAPAPPPIAGEPDPDDPASQPAAEPAAEPAAAPAQASPTAGVRDTATESTGSAPGAAGPQHRQLHGAGPSLLVDPGAPRPQPATEAIAILAPTSGNKVTGRVRFREGQRGQGLEVITEVEGLPPGKHAYHVHVFGDCSAPDASTAGPHFHFTGSAFDQEVPIITGDLGELEGKRGAARAQARIPDASLQGPFSIVGRAVVVHAKGNDPSVTPDGGAGARIACGVIGVAQVPVAEQTAGLIEPDWE